MTKVRSLKEAKCGLCSRAGRYLADFNGSFLCPRCFDEEITTFAEGRRFKLRVSMT